MVERKMIQKVTRKFTDQEISRREKLFELQKIGKDPYSVESCKISLTISEFVQKFKNTIKFDNEVFTLAGRIMAIRQTFGSVRGMGVDLQFYFNREEFPKKEYEEFKKYIDIGDIIEITGIAFRTQKGELTLKLHSYKLLAKSLRPLPEKWHGLQDEELRARQRYVDLIMNKESMKTFILRSKIVKLIRKFFDDRDYFEMETPVLNPRLGGANAKPFTTHHNTLKRDYFLRIATELPLKKLIVGGFDKIYEIGRLFRNEGMDSTHNPEFTSIEAYTTYFSMDDLIILVEDVIRYIAIELGKTKVLWGGNEIDLMKKFKVINMVDFINEVIGVDFWKITNVEEALVLAKKYNIDVKVHEKSVGHIINLFFEEFCEKECINPTFVWGHPIEVSQLAKRDSLRPGFTKRFELFINKKEIANAFSELNDPIDQENRFLEQINEKELGNDEAVDLDEDFLAALEYGMPPTGGFGMGIDRLIMMFAEKTSIRDVLLFPHMKEK